MKKIHTQTGQTLTALLIFMAILVTITAGSVVVIISNVQGAQKLQDGSIALQVAESAAENALLRLIRNPNYTGETMSIGQGTATIIATGTTAKTINIIGQYGNFSRKIRITAGYNNGILVVTPPWQEVYP